MGRTDHDSDDLRERIEEYKAKNERLRNSGLSRRHLLRAAVGGTAASLTLAGASQSVVAQSGQLPAAGSPALSKVECGQLNLSVRNSPQNSPSDGDLTMLILQIQTSGVKEIRFESNGLTADTTTEIGFDSAGTTVTGVKAVTWGS